MEIAEKVRGNQVNEGEYYGLVPFTSILSTVIVLRYNIAIMPFTESITWPLHRFYIKLFITAKVLQMTVDHESSYCATDENENTFTLHFAFNS